MSLELLSTLISGIVNKAAEIQDIIKNISIIKLIINEIPMTPAILGFSVIKIPLA